MAHGPIKKSTQINTKQHVGSNPGLNFNSDWDSENLLILLKL